MGNSFAFESLLGWHIAVAAVVALILAVIVGLFYIAKRGVPQRFVRKAANRDKDRATR